MSWILVIVCGYILGSISFGVIIPKILKGKDVREYGSGNAGMTNVLRTFGKGPAALVLLGDVAKGACSTAIGLYVGGALGAVLGGLAAMVGHTYPLFFGFRGGKGVATGLGIILTLVPDVTLIAIVIFILVVLLTRYVSLGSLLGSLSVPVNLIILGKPLPIIIFGVVGAAFIFYSHRTNIVRLYRGQEYKFQKQK